MFKDTKDLKWEEGRILFSRITSTQLCALCYSRWREALVVFLHSFFFLFKLMFLHFVLRIPVECLFFRCIFPFELLQSIHIDRKTSWEECSINMVTELSVFIINTDKICGHVTLFLLIWSFKTRSLCWTLMILEEGTSSHHILKWLRRSVIECVVSRLSKHLLLWIL